MVSAAARCCTAVATELSMSSSVAALSTTISSPRRRAATCDSSMIFLRDGRIGWIHQYGNPPGVGKELVQQLQSLGNELDIEVSESGDVPVRTSEARHETRSDRIEARDEDDRNRHGRFHRRLEADVRAGGEDEPQPCG
jgi:hypothetical protein